MKIKSSNIKISAKRLSELREFGIIDEIALRNVYLRKEFVRRTENCKRGEKKIVINQLALELGMSSETVSNILYQKINRKKPLNVNIRELK